MIVLKSPVVTEKTVSLYKDQNKVTFEVNINSTRDAATRALESVYGVKVEKAWVVNRLGKKGVNYITNREVTKRPNKKIMIFKLKDGDKISIFEQ